jgi:hypothetical protein
MGLLMWGALSDEMSGLSPTGLMTIFYCLNIEAPPTWSVRNRVTEVEVNLQLTVSPVLASGFHLEPTTRFLFSDSCGFLDVERPLMREWVCHLLVKLLLRNEFFILSIRVLFFKNVHFNLAVYT